MGFGIWDLGCGIWDLEFGVWGLRFGVWGLGSGGRVKGVQGYLAHKKLLPRNLEKAYAQCLEVVLAKLNFFMSEVPL